MASLRDNISTHRAINIGDIFKDADAKPNIKVKEKLSKLIEEIVSNGDEEINYSKNNFEFLQTKKFITNLILPEVKKYSYSDLPSIPETSQSTNFGDPTKISRENRNILPKNIKYFFIDAAMNPKDYKNKDLTEDEIVETFASYMDPATRSKPTTTLCNELLSFGKIYLNKYGFKNSCYVELLNGSTEKFMYIEIGINNLKLKCKIDRYGNILENNFVFTKDDRIIAYYDNVKNIFFKGNPEKNKYINENIYSTDDKKYISIMLLLLKELGDTMQAIILEKILKNAKISGSGLGNYLGNSCLLTNDTVLATRCSMLSVPFLLKHNFILTSYQPPISDADRRRILEAHDKNQKIQEIERIILNNDSVIKTLKEFLKETINNLSIKNIKLSKQTGENSSLNNRKLTNIFISNIIRKIENANENLKYILDIIKNDLNIVNLKLREKTSQKIYNKEDENEIIKICKAKFYIFRTYIYQLNAIKLFKKIEKINNETILTECYISTTKTSLFKTKIPIKLDGDTSNIDTHFSLINEDENEIFEQGFMNELKNNINHISGGSSRKKTSNSISYEDIYIKVYPYIYCYPWFIEYILDTENNEIIDKFLQELIDKDEVVKTLLNTIFSISNEDKYYELSLYNNIHDDKNLYDLKFFRIQFTLPKKKLTLLQKFRNYIMLMLKENTNTKSLSLPRKSNKATTLRKNKSLPNQRLTRKRDLERQTALPGKEKKLTAKRAKSSKSYEEKTAKRAKKITAKRARSSEEQNIAPESPKSPKSPKKK